MDKKIKICLVLFLALASFTYFTQASYAQLTPTEQAQEQGFDNFTLTPEQKTKDAQAIDKEGLVICKIGQCTFCDLIKLIERIFSWLLSMAFIVAVFFVVVSGFIYILSVGDSGTMSLAKEGLKYSLIGFVICLCSWLAIHLVYILLGYKGDTWWQIQCDSQKTSQVNEQRVAAELYKNEVPLESLGGRNNPIALPDLTKSGLANLPENKYFFIHGIGGQSLDKAAEQIENVVAKAEENKTIVYAVVPYRDSNNIITGTQSINLNNYLTAAFNDLVSNDNNAVATTQNQASTDSSSNKRGKFYDLMLSMLTKSVSNEIPLIMAKKGITVADFNQMWPKIDWNSVFNDKSILSFNPSTSTISGLSYKEGTGPVLYDPDRYNGVIPENDTHIEINTNSDGSLNTSNPITIKKVAPGVTEDTLKAYTQQLGSMLSSLQKKYQTQGNKGDFILDLTKLLAESQENYTTSDTESSDASQEKLNTNQENQQAVSFAAPWNTGGTGILPVALKVDNSKLKKPISDKTINNIEKAILEVFTNSGKTSSSSGKSQTSGSASSSNTGSSGSTSSSGGKDTTTGNWSGTSLGLKGQLSCDEIGRLDKEIVPKTTSDLSLNVPVDFVMCLINKESAFKPGAFNGSGERSVGLTQINTGVGTQTAALRGLKSYVNKNDQNNIYMKLRREVGTDQVLMSDAGLLSQRDPANARGITSVSMGIGYLKLINAKNGRGGGLKNYSDLDNLAAGYNAGPAGARGGNTAYSRDVVNCTKTMQNRRNAAGGKSPWVQDCEKKKNK